MNPADLTVVPTRLSRLEAALDGPLVLVDLEGAQIDPVDVQLPPCPVVGIGDPAHPLASRLDAVVEPPFTAEALARQVSRNPHAAATAVQVLRAGEGLRPRRALTLESMAYAMLQGSAEHAAWKAGRPEQPAHPLGKVGIERRDDVLEVVLDRPAQGNAIDRAMRDALAEALGLAQADETITRVQLRAAGKCFSLGADLGEFGTTCDPASAHMIRARTLPAIAAVTCAERLEAHIDGACIGAGLELAAFASRITATPRAWFQLPELAMGIIPGAGGCVSVPRRIGRQRAALLILSGRRIGARQALGWGLVDALVDDPSGDDGGGDVG